MKKLLSVFFVLILCLSLSACSPNVQNDNGVIGGKEDSTGGGQQQKNDPVSVELTMDNWEEYLGFASRYEAKFNGFGEVDDITYYFDICVNDEYLEKLDRSSSTVTVEISFARGTQYGTFSENKLHFTPGEFQKWEGAEKTEAYEFAASANGFGACYTLATPDFEKGTFGPFYPSEQKVLRITGTLVFK